MNFKYILFFGCLFFNTYLIAQAPLGFNYQGVALTNAGTPVSNKVISLRIALIESQQLGTTRFQETHNVNTDAYGQFSVIIGNGQATTGKMSDVQWSKFPYYMKVELDLTGGTSYVFVGTSQLLSVPYALYANNAGAASISVDSVKSELATIRLVQKGDSIVLNNGRGSVYIPKIDSLAKIASQISTIKSATIKVIKDSATRQGYGFAIGNDALKNMDSVVINSNNYAIGFGAGAGLVKGKDIYNLNENILLGTATGAGLGTAITDNFGANYNIFLGNYAGQNVRSNASNNVLIGWESGRFSSGTIPNKNASFNQNVAIGGRTMQYAINANANVSIGAENLNRSKDISRNVAIGTNIASDYNGDDNVIIGTEMLLDTSSNGSKNVIIGSTVARNLRGSGNVILGYKAANDSLFLNTSNKLIIANDKTKTPLIYGEFDNKKLVINGDLTVTGKLNGSSGSNSTFTDNFSNVFVGQNAGSNYQDVFKYGYGTNTAIGVNTLRNNTDYWNVAVGGNALSNGTNSRQNTAIGYNSMVNYKKGFDNVAVGYATLSSLDSGIYNTALGTQTLLNLKYGNDNTGLGYRALSNLKSGNQNLAIGWEAGNSLDTGSNNIFIGRYSGSDQIFKKISDKLIISNNPTSTPLIYGDFANRKLKFNADIDSLSILNRINFVDENANDHINKYDTGYSSPLIYSRYFYGHYGDLVIQGMSKTYTGNIHFVTGSNIAGYDPPTQRMVIMDNGNVGIGNFAPFNPPTSKLQVTGNVLATGYKTPTGTSSQFLMADGSVSSSTITSTVIPYTGASQAVDLGAFDMKVNGITSGLGGGQLNTNTVFGRDGLFRNTSGQRNTAIGSGTLVNNTSGGDNTAIGWNTLGSNTIGNGNTVLGSGSLSVNTTGEGNSVIGNSTLGNNTIGNYNTALGQGSMYSNITGNLNTAVGGGALYSNKGNNSSVAIGINAMQYADDRTNGRTTGNTAVGYESLKGSSTPANNTGIQNTAIGYQTLLSNTSGSSNVAIGYLSLKRNTSGTQNNALGRDALGSNTTGNYNVAIGYNALSSNTTGSYNIAIGLNALKSNNGAGGGAEGNIAIGQNAMASATSTRGNTSIGYASLTALTIGGDNTAIGEGTLASITESYSNTAIGSAAMYLATNNTQKSVAIGVRAGEKMNGGFNTFLGFESGAGNLGSGNVFLGSLSGFNAAFYNVSNKLIIQNADNAIPLVYGDFSSKQLSINGTLSSAGTIQAFSAKSTAYTILTSDEIITADATSGIFTITLPTAVGVTGQTYTIKRINSGSNAVTVGTTSSQTIDGSTTYVLSAQYKYVKIVSDGANWIIVGNN